MPDGLTVHFVDIDDLDITDEDQVKAEFSDFKPDLLINAAAYTAVDKAESEQELAYAVNATAVALLARWCKKYHTRLLHLSTDFVFAGDANTPYPPEAETAPKSFYGMSKAAGERALLEIYPENSLTIRVSWLYSSYGQNFVKTMLRLMRERDSLGIVNDQIGCPTWANHLARLIWQVIDHPDQTGVLHWSDAGSTTWYGFARAIMDEALALGLLEDAIELNPLTTAEYPTPAVRPHYSLLDSSRTCDLFKIKQVQWRENLVKMLKELAASP